MLRILRGKERKNSSMYLLIARRQCQREKPSVVQLELETKLNSLKEAAKLHLRLYCLAVKIYQNICQL